MPPRSSLPGIEWPAVPSPGGATALALAWHLERSQWWSADELRARQLAQLRSIVAHAATTTAYYGERIAPDADLADLPILTRDALIAHGAQLLSKQYPASHGDAPEISTSRSTGEPVRVRVPGILSAMWSAITLREHAWHRRDLQAKLAVIRYTGTEAPPPDGARGLGWGRATAEVAPDAPVALLSVASTTEQQVAWLVREDPAYLLVYPTVLGAIVRRLAATGQRLPSLREVRTISEAPSPETRALCRDVLGVPLVDTYSAQECGYIALQCPDHPHYHVQSERLLVEVLDDAGAACPPGTIGRVVITDLHNFATPLLRYDLGDFAAAGPPCACGRGLPVLERILGRRRGMLTYPDGRTVWPVFTVACREAARFREAQLVQDAVDRLRLRVVPEPDRPLTDADRAALIAALHRTFGAPFVVEIEVVSELSRSASGKLEEFTSRV